MKKKYKAVFRTHIDFDSNDSGTLLPGKKYRFENSHRLEFTYDDIVKKSKSIVNNDLMPELEKYTDARIYSVEVQSVYEGSIEIIYTVVVGFLGVVSGLKDLYDVIHLIKEISERYIRKELNAQFSLGFNVHTDVITPRNDYLCEMCPGRCPVEAAENSGRDIFFYYLLAANIILFLLIGVLVFGAVKTVYFG